MSRISNIKGSIHVASGAAAQPSNAKSGDIWFDSNSNALLVYDGSAWRGYVLTSTSTSTSTST